MFREDYLKWQIQRLLTAIDFIKWKKQAKKKWKNLNVPDVQKVILTTV